MRYQFMSTQCFSSQSDEKGLLCLGEALIDMICTDKGQTLSRGNNFLKKAGGAPANVAAAVAALGGRVEMSAKVGKDPFGDFLVDTMSEMGMGTRYVFRDPVHFTTFAFVSLMENGERDFFFNRGADGQLGSEDLGLLDLGAFDMLHFGSATAFLPGPLQSSYQTLLDLGIQQGAFISFDPNYRHLLFGHQQELFINQSLAYIKRCHFFKVSDEEAMLLTGAQTVDQASQRFFELTNAVFAITLGADGTLLGFHGEAFHIPSVPISPVDTTGAGDAFVGAVLYQLQCLPASERFEVQVDQWKAIVANGNKAGARTCAYMGAMEAFRNLNKDILL